MKFHRRRRADNGINLTPLIDVVFLLLIFFMVTTTFTKETRLLIELPEADGEVADNGPAPLELLIAKDGSYAVNGQNLINREIETIMATLQDTFEGYVAMSLMIAPEAQISYQSVISVTNGTKQYDLGQLNITERQMQE